MNNPADRARANDPYQQAKRAAYGQGGGYGAPPPVGVHMQVPGMLNRAILSKVDLDTETMTDTVHQVLVVRLLLVILMVDSMTDTAARTTRLRVVLP